MRPSLHVLTVTKSLEFVSMDRVEEQLTAQEVRTMTPLFPAWLTIGGPVAKALMKEPSPSHKMPPWILLLKAVPSISTPLISAVARISGIQLTAWQVNMMMRGNASAPSTDSLKVWTQGKVIMGACWIWVLDQ
jgi:hypothetical protein